MSPITKNLHAIVLKHERQVAFWNNGYFYYLEDHSNGGYNIDVYTNKSQVFDEKLIPVDGGVCEGCNEIDSINMMLDISE